MANPFHHFMEKIIDYAGLFPPAQLPMDEAIRNYADYRNSTDEWMLSRFICPVNRLEELKDYKDSLFNNGAPFRFSILSSNGQSQKQFFENLNTDLETIAQFTEYHGERVIADALEAKIPGNVLLSADSSATAKFLNRIASAVEKNGPPSLTAFYEAAFPKYWKNIIKAQIRGIAEHNHYISGARKFKRYRQAGFKLRCGGVEPHMYPTPEQVAFVIANCRIKKVSLKATAGLHHPLRHFNGPGQVKMHGFLNVFGAGILAEAHELEQHDILEIIEDEDPKNFIFTKRAFAWKNLRASMQDIESARSNNVISFGSCSFDEPREDLSTLKLL